MPQHEQTGDATLRTDAVALLRDGRHALQHGAWADAAAAFAALVRVSEAPDAASAEAWAGIGLASYWLGEAQAAIAAFERAVGQYREIGNDRAAARTALWLVDAQLGLFRAGAVANGWIEQADRLLAGEAPGEEHAWLLAYRGHYALFVTGDAQRALAHARRGQELARTLAAAEVEVVTLAIEGLALVQLGNVEAGMARLDEASAAAFGRDLADLNAIAWACCYVVHGCECIRDLPRAEEWCRRVITFCEERGLAPVYTSCRIDYAAVLTWRGEWDAAEAELARAGAAAQRGAPGLEPLRLVRLAELRRRQGRLDEAEALLRRGGEEPLAAIGLAALALDRDEADVALDLSERALRLLPDEAWVDRVDALLVLVRALAARGDAARAQRCAAELGAIADRAGTALLRGSAACARGIAARAAGEPTLATAALEEAVAYCDRGGAPYDAARARLELAAVLAGSGRHATARSEAARARDAFALLGAQRDAARADAFLHAPPLGPARAGSAAPPLSRREIEILRLVARGWSNERIAAELFLSRHTVKRHVANILRKLDCPSRAAAVAEGVRLELLS
jgi:DNA-binding CsgD family transcriptional regulator/tetratricopeptide (TPR) repeat protein